MTDCPTDEELIAFARGKLAAEKLPPIHAHLDACGTCQLVLAEAARAFATAVTAPISEDVDWNTTFQRGAVVAGRYVISRFIARGAMGEVYEAYDRELAERVALKTVASTACDNTRAVRRLKAEVQLARRVSHPNVCRIYDFGTHVMPDSGVSLHFLTMEFVEGETLGQRVRLGGPLPLLEAIDIGRELLLALCAAHGAGVLHRDFKSDNVMLKLAPGERATPVVLDFGLARALDHPPTASASRSTFVGTFGYMAPELLEGMPHSTASDVYAFGVVWFEMLTGQLPFEGAASPALALKCLQSPAPAPSSLNRAVPSGIDALVSRCLERSPRDRFRTPGDVLDALTALNPDGKSSTTLEPVATATTREASGVSSWLPARGSKVRRGVAATLVAGAMTYALFAWFALRSPEVNTASTAERSLPTQPTSFDTSLATDSRGFTPTPSVTALPAPAATANPSALPGSSRGKKPARDGLRRAEGTQPAPPVASAAPTAPAPEASPAIAPSPEVASTGDPQNFAISAPSAATADAPSARPLSTRPTKPNWENPFGEKKPPLRAQRSGNP